MLTGAGPTIMVGTRTRGTRVSSSPSKIPYGEFSSVRLQRVFHRDLHPLGVARTVTPGQLIRGLSS